MKITLALLLASHLLIVCHSANLPSKVSYDNDLEDAADETESKEAVQDPQDERIKRNGGKAIVGFIGERIQAGISNTLTSSIGKIASASSGLLTKKGGPVGGHGGGGGHHEYGPPAPPPPSHDEGKGFDVWSFKKSIVSTLLQAVKAITGGVIGIGGKVTQGAGHVVEAKGRLLQQAGEQIFGFGKHVSQKAYAPIAPPAAVHHHHSSSVSHHSHSGYDGPVPVSSGYPPSGGHIQQAPLVAQFTSYGQSGLGQSGLESEYGPPQGHYLAARAAKPSARKSGKFDTEGAKSGLLILKPINVPALDRNNNQLHHASSEQFQRFAPPPQSAQAFTSSDSYQEFQPSPSASSNNYKQYQPASKTASSNTFQKYQPLTPTASSNNYQHFQAASQTASSNNYQQYVPSAQAKTMTIDNYQNFEPARLRKSVTHAASLPSDNYQSFAVPPRAIKRSFNVAPVQYQPSLGYALPDIEYEE